MKTKDEYIQYIQWHLYDFISWTGEWLAQPAILIGPYGSVSITIGHVFLAYFILSALGLLWLRYKLNQANYPTNNEMNDAYEDWLESKGELAAEYGEKPWK